MTGIHIGDQILDFACHILENVKIKTHMVSNPFLWDDAYDSGLRKSILTEYKLNVTSSESNSVKDLFQNEMEIVQKDNCIHSIRDDFNCEYICLRIPYKKENVNLLIGPFTYEVLTVPRITELCERSNIPHHLHDFMQQFYSSIPYVSDERWLKSIVWKIAEHFYGDSAHIQIIRNRIEVTSNLDAIFLADVPEPNEDTITMLEQRYEHENQMMTFISVGDYEGIERLMQEGALPKPAQRFPDTIRDTKNGLIILNTLCRKAAEKGHVHPVYLDDISKRYAAKIENCNNNMKLNQMSREILRKYCILVQKHSLKNYTQPIRDVITQISFHLNSDLTLDTLSDLVCLNKSYLSSLFKKETGETLTNYVNTRRIDHSIYLLNTTKLSIQDIAALCGIPDLNYFTKLFKKIKNMTPSEYRNMIHSL